MRVHNRFMPLVLAAALVSMAVGCSVSNNENKETPTVPHVQCKIGSCTDLDAGPVVLSNGDTILLYKFAGKLMFAIDGTLNAESFALLRRGIQDKPSVEQTQIMKNEVNKILKKMESRGAIGLESYPEVGYFTALYPVESELFQSLKDLKFAHSLIFSYVNYAPEVMKQLRELNPAAEGLVPRSSASPDYSSLSGLKRIEAPQFVEMVQSEVGGEKIDGSSARLGITDTGITYNHPTFKSKSGANRIVYMKDFTGEGTVYVHPNAKFEVTAPNGGSEEDLVVNAEVIATPKLPSLPLGDQLSEVKDLKIKVNKELRELLLNANTGAKLGVILEDAFQGDTEPVDINANGKLDDKLYIIYIPGESASIYLDTSGTADFRKSKAIHDWNASKDTVKIFAESVGFHFGDKELAHSDGNSKVAVKTVAIVGYDPGNHGSHVAGIAAGSKTISNDNDLTLARGVAPEAQILMNRVCANNGGCNARQAFIDLVVKGKAELVNMSLGGLSNFNDGYGVEAAMINRLTDLYNTLFIISSGNSGPGLQTHGSPSNARMALSIGASASRELINAQYVWPGFGTSSATGENDDFMLFFSSRGPNGSGGFKPNIAAPGTELSSIQLNAAPGLRAGLDVYWGTSMAAPTAAGAYALFLDGVKKYNKAYPGKALSTNSRVLRQVFIDSAKPFDVSRTDLQTGSTSKGQYTWVDQGTGLLNLPAAWNKLKSLRDSGVVSNVKTENGEAVELDYRVVTEDVMPNGIAYNGSQASNGEPAYGSGIYLKHDGTDSLKLVSVIRSLPEAHATDGDLHAKLTTTRDEFELRTVIHGSDVKWVRAGVMEQLNCADSPDVKYGITGQGAVIADNGNSTWTLTKFKESTMSVCILRSLTAKLPPGDHGALISAHLIGANGKVSPVASFIVPVYLTVPHKVMKNSSAYEIESEVKSFGVSRNYVQVPAGTSVMRITLEVPEVKLDSEGQPLAYNCSGVELMALLGNNTAATGLSRSKSRIANCKEDGSVNGNRKLVITRENPNPGIWNLHVFGQYRFANSKFKLRVDYVTGAFDKAEVAGSVDALNGKVGFKVAESSLEAIPSAKESSIILDGLSSVVKSQVDNEKQVVVEGVLGKFRVYPTGTKSVTVTTENSPGNDIDLFVYECPKDLAEFAATDCTEAGSSGGSTDVEKVNFTPKADKSYAVVALGYSIKDEGKFTSSELMSMGAETGAISLVGSNPYTVMHSFTDDQIKNSPLLNSDLFKGGKVSAAGSLTLRMADKTVMGAIPVMIKK